MPWETKTWASQQDLKDEVACQMYLEGDGSILIDDANINQKYSLCEKGPT